MTPADFNFATDCIRGIHTALSAFKRWVATKPVKPEDEAFIGAIDRVGAAAKDWLRAKVVRAGQELKDEDSQG